MKNFMSFSASTLAMLLLMAPAHAQQQQQQLRLSAGDTIALSVLNRPELTGQYRLRSNGTISMHFLGQIDARGLTEAALEGRIEALIEQQTSLPSSATVEVLEWRATTVAGDVVNPGIQDFEIGQTVAQALALAGGAFPRVGEVSGSSLDVRIAGERAEIQRREVLLADLHARRIRLEAEAAGLDRLESDPMFAKAAGALAEKLLAGQSAILSAQQREDMFEIATARRNAELSDTEIEALEGQQRILAKSIADSEEAVERAEDLLQRGLSNADRVRALRSTLNDENIQLMQAASFEARAQLQKAGAEASIDALRISRQTDLAQELYEVTTAIENTRVSIEASRQLIAQVQPLAQAEGSETTTLAPPHFRIRRKAADGAVDVLLADIDTLLQPGDVLEIKRGGWLDPTN